MGCTDNKSTTENHVESNDPNPVMNLEAIYEEAKGLEETSEDEEGTREVSEEEKEYAEEVEGRRNDRNNLSLEDALKGTWLIDQNTVMIFDELYLRQGDNTFRYEIIEEMNDIQHITVYGLEGFLIEETKLFEAFILYDESRTSIQYKKIVNQLFGSDLEFRYNAVYIDENQYVLGSFRSEFFTKSHPKF